MQRILIVDDFASARQVLRHKLEMYGYACQEAEDGSEALKAIQTKHFDLCDYRPPNASHDWPAIAPMSR